MRALHRNGQLKRDSEGHSNVYMEGHASHSLAHDDSDADDEMDFQQPNADLGHKCVIRVTGFVARIGKPHVGKAGGGSEECAAKHAHELSAFSYQVDVSLKVRRFSNTVTHFRLQTDCTRKEADRSVQRRRHKRPSKSPP